MGSAVEHVLSQSQNMHIENFSRSRHTDRATNVTDTVL